MDVPVCSHLLGCSSSASKPSSASLSNDLRVVLRSRTRCKSKNLLSSHYKPKNTLESTPPFSIDPKSTLEPTPGSTVIFQLPPSLYFRTFDGIGMVKEALDLVDLDRNGSSERPLAVGGSRVGGCYV